MFNEIARCAEPDSDFTPVKEPQKMYDVIALSQALVDVTAHVPFSFLKEHDLEKGTTIHLSKEQSDYFLTQVSVEKYSAGSTAANTLCGVACLGGKVAYVSRLAKDDLGEIFKQALADEHITFCGTMTQDNLGTGRCIVLITPDADRTMLTYLGAAHHFRSSDYDAALLRQAKIVLVEAYQLETPLMFEATREAVNIAKDAGAMIVLSAANASCLQKHSRTILSFMESSVDFFIGNVVEYQALTDISDEIEALRFIMQRANIAAMTAGCDGAYVAFAGSITHVAAPPIDQVVDTCGAGDQFLAGFLYALSLQKTTEEALQYASVMSSSVLDHAGARPTHGYTMPQQWLETIAFKKV